ncbi:MAG: hypothetical protein RLZZ65_1387 [Bacteroidota bacterium]|jgi:histidine triad (HIT) family protein
MSSIFSRIVNGEIPCHKIAETADFLAFLDVQPLAIGHTLVIPKKEVDYIFDLDDATFLGLHAFAKEVAILLKSKIECKRIGLSVIGLEVPHAHIHLIPLQSIDDINFSKKKLSPTQEELAAVAALFQ